MNNYKKEWTRKRQYMHLVGYRAFTCSRGVICVYFYSFTCNCLIQIRYFTKFYYNIIKVNSLWDFVLRDPFYVCFVNQKFNLRKKTGFQLLNTN